jgi:hypothetical protein
MKDDIKTRGGSRPKNPGRIRDGSTIRIRHGVVFLFPAIREQQYVRTIYSGSVRRHYLRTYYVLSYSTHWIRHGSTRIRLVQGGIPELSVPARFYCRDPPPLIKTPNNIGGGMTYQTDGKKGVHHGLDGTLQQQGRRLTQPL